MKNTRFSRLAALVLVCAIAICAFASVLASAEEAAPTAEINTANVAYNEMVQLAFTITSANLPEGAELGIMTWAADAAEFTAATASYVSFEASEKSGTTYYKTAGIPAPEMDTPIYVAAVYKVEGVITIAEAPFKYSALQYAGTRLTETTVTAKQAKLYSDLIEYGMASDDVFENSENYAFVKAVNGTIFSAGAEIGGWAGKEVLLRAEAKNADGEYFIKWINAEGEEVSSNRLAYVTAPEAGVDTYTAVFGERTASPYASTYNLEYLNTGALSAIPGGMSSLSNNDGTYNSYYITESMNGDKQLLVDRITSGAKGYSAKVKIPSTTQVTAVEYDLEFTEAIADGTLNNIIFSIKDADGTTATVRLNITYHKDENLHLYMESTKWTSVTDANEKVAYINCSEGSTVTLTFALDLDNIKEVPVEVITAYKQDAEGNYLDADGNITTDSTKYVAETTATYTSYTCDLLVYANGKLFGKVDLNACNKSGSGYYKEKAQTFDANGVPSFLLDKSCTFTSDFGISSLNAASKDISLDNFMYYDLIDETATE